MKIKVNIFFLQIVWFKHGRHLHYGSASLPVELMSKNEIDRTAYSCMATNEAGTAEQHYRIKVLGEIFFQ